MNSGARKSLQEINSKSLPHPPPVEPGSAHHHPVGQRQPSFPASLFDELVHVGIRRRGTVPPAASAGRPNAARMHFDRAYERGRQQAANASQCSPSLSAGGSSSASLSNRGGRPSKKVLDQRREDGVNDALQGQDHQGRTHVLKHCRHPVDIDGEQCPCHFNLWARRSGSTGKEELETHTRKWLDFSESRRREELTTLSCRRRTQPRHQ